MPKPSETVSFYSGQIEIEVKPWGDHYRYKKVGTNGGLLSATGITKYLDKSRALLPWAVSLVGTHITSTVQSRTVESFSKEEIFLIVNEAVLKPEEAKVKGGAAGDKIHDFAHDFAKSKMLGIEPPTLDHLNGEDPEDLKALNGINAFLDWYNENDVKFLQLEKLVYYNSLLAGDTTPEQEVIEYLGIMDVLAEVNGKIKVMDYKTGKAVYTDQRYQLSGYRKAWNSNPDNSGQFARGSEVLNFSKETGELFPLDISEEESELDFNAFKGLYAVALREKQLTK